MLQCGEFYGTIFIEMRLKLSLIKLAVILIFASIIIPTSRVLAAPPSTPVWVQSDFWFRDDNGDEITATGLADGDIPKNGAVIIDNSDYGGKRVFRLRIGFRVQQADGDIRPRLEFKEGLTADCSKTGNWQIVGASDAIVRYILRDSPNLTNAASTTQQITGGQFVSGKFLDAENPPATAQTVTKNYRTEYEWSVEYNAIEFTPDKKYIFRVTNNGTPFDNYIGCPIVYFSKITGGGQPTEIRFSGQAYPDAKITIFAKDFDADLPIKKDEIKSPDGNFHVSYTGIIQNAYNYSLVIEDKNGRVSQVKSYNLDVYANALSMKDFLAPPTLGLLKNAVIKSNLLNVSGYASPGNTVAFEIDNGIMSGKIKSAEDGQYRLAVNTAGLNFGNHRLKTRQSDSSTKISDWSPTVLFAVSESSLLTDYNNDGIVNVSDFGIFLYGWTKTDENIIKQLDLNKDDKIDISDFGIFIRNIKI